MRTITSAQNPAIKELRELRQAKGRQQAGRFLAEGAKLCAEALRDAQVATLLVDQDRAEEYARLISQAQEVLLAPAHVVASVCETKTPQGIVASVRIPAPLDLDTAHGAVLVLDGMQDPGNVGTMLRTAEAAGFSAALLSPAAADAFAPKTVRATMGSIYRLPLWRGALPEALSLLRRKGFRLVATAMDGEPLSGVAPVAPPLALVIGSEGNGISQPVTALTDVRVSLPMRGRTESLNAAVAAGILMYALQGLC
ncbi:RNA methyltransferase [Eubacteriales bacterium OttesenSCG-928-A19]|nr:RNA methyltransferase [Eubacteriales bacterium OttesenSCG-928-A19]